MDEFVTHPCHFPPGDFGKPVSDFFGNALGNFTEDFEFPDNGAEGLVVGTKCLKIHVFDETFDGPNGGQDVLEIQAEIPHNVANKES